MAGLQPNKSSTPPSVPETTTSARVALTMHHTGADRDLLVRHSQGDLRQLDAFLLGEGPLTPGIAFAISRATGTSATAWMTMAEREKITPLKALVFNQHTKDFKSHALREILSTENDTNIKVHAAQALGAQGGRNPEVAAALLKSALFSNEPELFRASVEALAGHSVRAAEAVCEGRLNGGGHTVHAEALHTLYALNPDAGVRKALDVLKDAASDSTLAATSREVLERYAGINGTYAHQAHEEKEGWLTRVESILRAELTSGTGSYELRQPEGYEPPLLGAHLGVLFEEREASLRQRSLMSLRTRAPEIAELAALLTVSDEDPLIRRTAVAVLHFMDSTMASEAMHKLANDPDPRVVKTARALLAERSR
jgi:HEAT repeat protein